MNKLEIVFSNPLSIDLEIEKMKLIGEMKELTGSVSPTNEPPLRFTLDLKHQQQQLLTPIDDDNVKIPANSVNYRVEFGFTYTTLDEFKIIGYELTSSTLRMHNEIMFSEISSSKANDAANSNNSSSRLANMNKSSDSSDLAPVLSSYDVKMIPKLPVIKSLELFSSDLNQNRQCVSQMVNSKYLIVPAKLGVW